MFRRQVFTSIKVVVVLLVLLCGVYPAAVWAVGQVAFKHQADGSFVSANGKVVGSSLIGQSFTDKSGNPVPRYFQPRPSATEAPGPNGHTAYDPTNSGGSNLGPSNTKLFDAVKARVVAYRQLNGLAADASVPVDAVTASGSGLDPDISIANAMLQAPRVARARGLALDTVKNLINTHTDGRPWGVLGEKTVNVLDLNLALDKLSPPG
ncbi:MAG: K(+)-transporting ATPase subunit C [Acidimicrobiia bacterium]|nr:K(+)-transporting ATPase subunit C [Acidimicrobiia bacterium]